MGCLLPASLAHKFILNRAHYDVVEYPVNRRALPPPTGLNHQEGEVTVGQNLTMTPSSSEQVAYDLYLTNLQPA